MRGMYAVVLCGILFASYPSGARPKHPKQTAPAPKREATYNPDIDLKNTPASYRKRVLEFRQILRKEPNREAKIKRAIALAIDPKSKFRPDAIDFLGDVRAREAVPALLTTARDAPVREFALHTLGELRDARTIPVFILYLDDENDNVRGIAYKGIANLIKQPFFYRYNAPKDERAKSIEEIQRWWQENHSTYRMEEPSGEEKKQAEEAWRKYGEQYLHDLSR
ncbi:MAG: HEAT repeat domain-containing protein [Pseudomonadota bacterium]